LVPTLTLKGVVGFGFRPVMRGFQVPRGNQREKYVHQRITEVNISERVPDISKGLAVFPIILAK